MSVYVAGCRINLVTESNALDRIDKAARTAAYEEAEKIVNNLSDSVLAHEKNRRIIALYNYLIDNYHMNNERA